jgi:hypothetical protein
VLDSGKVIQPERRIEVLTYTSGQNFAGLQVGPFTLTHGRISPEFVSLPGRGGDPNRFDPIPSKHMGKHPATMVDALAVSLAVS